MAASRSISLRKIRRSAGTTGRRSSGNVKQRAGRRIRTADHSAAVKRSIRFNHGYAQGYQLGVQTGIQRYPTLFEGTSIVIPTYNQKALVKQCIETIKWNTPEQYEIIVVDNASIDGTGAYLQTIGSEVRYRVMDRNYGFAGAINAGLMMAKGRTIVLLNNDTLVTTNWLNNMLRCLYSDDGIGMVGPITNNISGIQRVKVPYASLSAMPEFARRNNRPDPSRWLETDQLIGFCLLFRRELFEEVGYFDEGFEIGNFEDNDYSVRVRLLGKKLMIAQDSFIHHIGSVSIKAVGDRMANINNRNEQYFTRKWPNLSELLDLLNAHSATRALPVSTASLYPERIVVRGIGADYYWIEGGQRRLVDGVLNFPVVKMSQIDLRRWPVGEPIQADEAMRRWFEGTSYIARTPDGAVYYREGNFIRRLHSEEALQGWGLHMKPMQMVTSSQISELQAGLPIISPPIMKQLL